VSRRDAVVLVVGSVNADLVFSGVPAHPVPGQTIRAQRFAIMQGGKGANAAAAVARLGGRSVIVGAVGADDAGTAARRALDEAGVDTRFLRAVAEPTGTAAIVVDEYGENTVVIAAGANALVGARDADAVAIALAGSSVALLANLEVPLPAVRAWAALAREHGWPVVLNPAPAPPDGLPADLLTLVDVLTPNESEAEALSAGRPADLLARGVGALVVTQGRHGARLHRPDRPPAHQPAFPVDPVDTTGAGDAFNAALTLAIAEGLRLDDAMRWAAAAGALSTRLPGTRDAVPQRDEIEALLASSGTAPPGVAG
jgi:ribokinase